MQKNNLSEWKVSQVFAWGMREPAYQVYRNLDLELEPGEEKPSTVAPADGQTGKSLENEYPSLF